MTGPFAHMATLEALNDRWRAARAPQERWDILREVYAIMLPKILRHRVDPYFLDWTYHRTPIEELAWIDIRTIGLPFYPQVPALKYFLDFADPVQKIAVELDGAAYHEVTRDRQRDMALLNHGWRTFRVPGKRSLASGVDIADLLADCRDRDEATWTVIDWGQRWSEGFFWALGHLYYRKRGIGALTAEGNRHAALEILAVHRLVDFALPGEEDEE